jgi:pyruvate/2-oxoglutarate/acetoin dehydrogenase E1 component
MRAGPSDNAPLTQQPETAYFTQLCLAMERLAQHPRSVFMGQSVRYPGTGMHNTLRSVPMEKRVEWPVAEDMQLGAAIGASLNGTLPVCMYPRINFLLCAIPQLVLHLDRLPLFSSYKPKVIIRTAIATDKPLDPGAQHLGDFVEPIKAMLKTVRVVRLDRAQDIVPQYRAAMEREGSTLLIEQLANY